MLKIIKSVLSIIFQARILFVLFYFYAFVTCAPIALILGVDESRITLSAIFHPLTILSCAMLAIYIGFKVSLYKNHGTDGKTDSVFFVALSWVFFMVFCLAALLAAVFFIDDARGIQPRTFFMMLLALAIFAAWRTLKSSEYKLSVFHERKAGAKINIDKILAYSVLVFATVVAILFLVKQF